MRQRILVLCVALVAAAGIGAATPTTSAAPAAVAKTCRAGYVHAVIQREEKCLHAGEFCRHSLDRVYRRYGFRCTRYDARVHRYRLTRTREP
jgi:hypothetical protein